MSAVVDVRITGGVHHVTMQRPAARNALSDELKIGLVAAIEAYEQDVTARVLVLAGCDCGAFSAGGDLRRVHGRLTQGLPIADPSVPDLFAVFRDRSKPIIAAVDGYALGGGFELALACDIRVATTASSFGLPEPRAGLLGQFGLDNLSRMVPLGEALRLQLTGGRIPAARAYAIGLVQELASSRAELFERAHALAAEIALCSPEAVRTIRHVVLAGRDLPPDEAEQFSAPFRDRVHSSAEAFEGVSAFLEKRAPRWVAEVS
jgi:enoyl-CoA hydratase